MSSKVSSFIMQIFRIIGSKTSISQMNKQGNAKIAYMFKYPRAKDYPAKHNLQNHGDKKVESIRIIMQKTWYFLEQYSICLDFLKIENENKNT